MHDGTSLHQNTALTVSCYGTTAVNRGQSESSSQVASTDGVKVQSFSPKRLRYGIIYIARSANACKPPIQTATWPPLLPYGLGQHYTAQVLPNQRSQSDLKFLYDGARVTSRKSDCQYWEGALQVMKYRTDTWCKIKAERQEDRASNALKEHAYAHGQLKKVIN